DAELEAVKAAIAQMQRLILRHEDAINLQRIETSYVAHMRISTPEAIVAGVYRAASGWKQAKETNPDSLNKPLRATLITCVFLDLRTRVANLTPDQATKLKDLQWYEDSTTTWHYVKWTAGQKKLVRDEEREGINTADVLKVLGDILRAATCSAPRGDVAMGYAILANSPLLRHTKEVMRTPLRHINMELINVCHSLCYVLCSRALETTASLMLRLQPICLLVLLQDSFARGNMSLSEDGRRTAEEFELKYGAHPYRMAPERFMSLNGFSQQTAHRIGLFPSMPTCLEAAVPGMEYLYDHTTDADMGEGYIQHFLRGTYKVDSSCLPDKSPSNSVEEKASAAMDFGFITWHELQELFDEVPAGTLDRGDAQAGTDRPLLPPKAFVTGAYSRSAFHGLRRGTGAYRISMAHQFALFHCAQRGTAAQIHYYFMGEKYHDGCPQRFPQ
ncbi:unnamed protein product, partial [Symbiodinium necroappetens]